MPVSYTHLDVYKRQVECPEEAGEQAKAILQEEMMRVAKLNVPLIADAHIGKNWLDAK